MIRNKKIISILILTFCFCLVIGTGYIGARYSGIFDAGEFILSLKAGSSGDVDPGAEYTLVYHTFDENGADIEYKTEKIYENLTVTIEGAPAAHSDLTFMGWSPQGSWIDEGEGYTFVPEPSDQKDNIYLDSYVPEQRILHTAFSQKTGGELLFLHSDETDTIHLYDLYEEYYVKFDGTQTSVQWVSIDFSIYSHSQTEIFVRRYWGQNFLTESNGVVNSIGYKLYGTTKTHYINPALSYYVGVHSTVDNGDKDAQGDYQYTATTTLHCSYNGVTETVGKETYAMWDGCRTFIPMVTNKENSNYSTSSCIAAGTLITMADGTQKEIQNVTYEDKLLVWDSFAGRYVVVSAALIVNHGFGEYSVIEMNFDDGTTVKAIGAHAFLDAYTNAWELINANNVQDYLGHSFVRADGDGYTIVKLIDCKVYEEYTESYTIVSAGHYNFIAENMFSLTNAFHPFVGGLAFGADWTYDEEMLRQDVETYGLYTYDDFRDYITEEQFVAFSGEFLKVSVEKGYLTFESILRLIEEYLYE